jgi:hypothetical protein
VNTHGTIDDRELVCLALRRRAFERRRHQVSAEDKQAGFGWSRPSTAAGVGPAPGRPDRNVGELTLGTPRTKRPLPTSSGQRGPACGSPGVTRGRPRRARPGVGRVPVRRSWGRPEARARRAGCARGRRRPIGSEEVERSRRTQPATVQYLARDHAGRIGKLLADGRRRDFARLASRVSYARPARPISGHERWLIVGSHAALRQTRAPAPGRPARHWAVSSI